jgi:glycogen debranching enzyme
MFQSRAGCIMDAGGLFYGDTGDGKWIAPDYYDEANNPSTGPCVTGIAVWDVYQKTGSLDFLKRMYPHLVMYERWITKAKASGIDPDLIAYHNWFDVGWDDSKRWGKGWVGNTKYPDIDWDFPVAPVDANVFFMKLRENLSKMAALLGDADRASDFADKTKKTANAIDRLMWNETKGYYFDLLPKGRMSDVWTPAGLLPMMAGIPSKDKYARLREHLFDPKKFWSKYPLPTIVPDDETFTMNMWSGGVWICVNWQVLQGLFDYDADAASQLLWRTIDMMTHNGHPVCSEYYGPKEGEPKGGHDYGWTTLVMDLILRHIAGINPKGDRVELTPRLPADWPEMHLGNIFVLGTNLDIRYTRSANGLKAMIRNNGAKAVQIVLGGEPMDLRPASELIKKLPKAQ